jgi:hypothetical protein
MDFTPLEITFGILCLSIIVALMGAWDGGFFPFHNNTAGRMRRYGKYTKARAKKFCVCHEGRGDSACVNFPECRPDILNGSAEYGSKPMKDSEGIINCGNCEHWQNVQFKGKGVCALSKQHGKKIFCACALFTDKEFCCIEHKKLNNV